jgi:hypothetical protein
VRREDKPGVSLGSSVYLEIILMTEIIRSEHSTHAVESPYSIILRIFGGVLAASVGLDLP